MSHWLSDVEQCWLQFVPYALTSQTVEPQFLLELCIRDPCPAQTLPPFPPVGIPFTAPLREADISHDPSLLRLSYYPILGAHVPHCLYALALSVPGVAACQKISLPYYHT